MPKVSFVILKGICLQYGRKVRDGFLSLSSSYHNG